MKILTLALMATGIAAMMYKNKTQREAAKPQATRAGTQTSGPPTVNADGGARNAANGDER